MTEIKVVFSRGDQELVGIYDVKNQVEEDLLISSLSDDLEEGWFIDEVFGVKNE